MDGYDVFLNHRGPDVKGAFISHLHEALKSASLKPFLDKISLVKAGSAPASMDAALQRAKVHDAVVSEGYADSKYCLSELAAMMRSGKPVIPVFYGVEPAQLRHVEKGLFASAFEEHKSKEGDVRACGGVGRGSGKLADTTGFRLSDFKEDEAQLKREVVAMVLSWRPTHMPTHEDLLFGQHLVGVKNMYQ